MPIYKNDGENVLTDPEAYYEMVASQEEIYLEETEEELRSILIFGDPVSTDGADEQLDHAAEQLITGDSDDPPLSDEIVDEMLSISQQVLRKLPEA
jgi:hypothetical protein